MRLFSIGHKEKLESIKEQPFKLEKEIQKISEDNLEKFLGLISLSRSSALIVFGLTPWLLRKKLSRL